MLLEPKDFPQMWQKPSSEHILKTLRQLELSPPIWSHECRRSDIIHEQEASVYFRREVSMYLSSIIKSGLAWIESDDEKEEIWSEASQRLTERCGRTAMGEITRRWPFSENALAPTFELIIREPPLTGDSLGLKTWGSSYVLAKYLPKIGSSSLFRLFDESLGQQRPAVLELGSGTGLLGLAAAALWKVHVILSDLPDILSNLRHNVESNRATVEKLGGSLDAGALTWGGSEDEVDQDLFAKKNQFKVVLAADPMYDDDHPGLLASAFSDQLSPEEDARAVVMVPLRDETTRELLKSFREVMNSQTRPLFCIEEGILDGQDDWGDDESSPVSCWWGIFAHQPTDIERQAIV
ncbi:Protein-lysine N-methyltransferase EFM2 [Colletotrichum trifolii]|uniref:Protein-lysine N-methyltransferase EFM2 n=1 Tax=Colletotrichum trifolii TaxID=5466 RepID=A0A4R8RG77_COLTR|nr:Protein-lysine N-methyltransferase EFM2 [Colletotrichum trifolii]